MPLASSSSIATQTPRLHSRLFVLISRIPSAILTDVRGRLGFPLGLIMRLSYLTCFCLLLVPVLAAPQLPADEPKKAAEKAPDLTPPTAKELADKRMVFMKSALSHFTIQVGDRKEESRV